MEIPSTSGAKIFIMKIHERNSPSKIDIMENHDDEKNALPRMMMKIGQNHLFLISSINIYIIIGNPCLKIYDSFPESSKRELKLLKNK